MKGAATAQIKACYIVNYTVKMKMNKNHKGQIMAVNLYPDSQSPVEWRETADGNTFISNGLVLQLEKGSDVSMRLPAEHALCDDSDKKTTVSGFLLFSIRN